MIVHFHTAREGPGGALVSVRVSLVAKAWDLKNHAMRVGWWNRSRPALIGANFIKVNDVYLFRQISALYSMNRHSVL